MFCFECIFQSCINENVKILSDASEATFSEAQGSIVSIFLKCKTTVCQLAQVGSQSEELKPSLKEAGTEVNWEVVGPIIAGDYFFFSYTF